MDHVSIQPAGSIGGNFIPAECLPPGKDEYYLRNSQLGHSPDSYRSLRADEIDRLVQNGNLCDNWNNVRVSGEFDPALVRNNQFFGLVRMGRLQNIVLGHHGMTIPAGITNSFIVACDIGDNSAVHNVRYMAHYIIGDRCILLNIDEMHTASHARFGNGIVKDGKTEDMRIWLELVNEAGGRSVLPFEGMLPADAYLWVRYRDDKPLMKKFVELTQTRFDSRRGYYGTVGEQCVIKNSRILKDVKIGPHCYIKGANKLKNLTIQSSSQEPTQIGEGVELVNGIIGFGCSVFYGCKAVRFILGDNSSLKIGARLMNSFLGDNSTIACCEVLNSLIFPGHEQHHNNSFLIAALVGGQSNIAAGATLGSNHNSRASDNELQAGRGFWPGLCTSIKQPSRFASFTLLAKGDYPAELDVRLPFSLVSNNAAQDRLEVIPAFWWRYNMYALARNTSKFQSRDNRVNKTQHIEFESLAPDTIEEVIYARRLLEIWTGKAVMQQAKRRKKAMSEDELAEAGRELLCGSRETVDGLEIVGENMEKSQRKTVIFKAYDAYHAYGQMLLYYAVKNLILFLRTNGDVSFDTMQKTLSGSRLREWGNLGGQLVPARDIDRLRADAGSGKLASWNDIHKRYDELWMAYPLEKQKHAMALLCELYGVAELTKEQWLDALQKTVSIQEYVCEQVYISRRKDFDNPFAQAMFRSGEEMTAVMSTAGDNAFVKQIRAETEQFKHMVETIGRAG
jgi:hypothetical protein